MSTRPRMFPGQRLRLTSPYKGLAPFEDSELDEQLFFGREHEREVIVANIVAARLTVLYGPTGVGKSSVLRAGVARDLRALAEEPLVVVCDVWSEAPAATIAEAVAAAASVGPGSLSDTVEVAASEHREIYLLLDQVEEYFVYHGGDPALGEALAELVTRPELPVHILVAIREDALARLDAFKRRLPGLLANRLQLEHLSVASGRLAIIGPVERFATLAQDGDAPVVEPQLVDAVLAGVSTTALIGPRRGRGSTASSAAGGRIETPYLQIVMERVWEVEREAGSGVLRQSTLEQLGGPARIVGQHLERALESLTAPQKEVAARVFNHLVTPSGTKIAHGTQDLAGWVGVPEVELEPVLQALARERILRPVRGAGSTPAYEIFHDVLADAVLAWRTEFEARAAVAREREAARRRHRRLLIIVVAGALALAAMGAVTLYALSQRDSAQRSEAAAKTSLKLASTANVRADRKAADARRAARDAQRQADRAKRASKKATTEAKIAKHQAARARRAAKAAIIAEAAQAKSARAASAAAVRATTAELVAQAATKRATAAEKLQAHLTVVATGARKKALAAQAHATRSARIAQSEALAYQSRAVLESAPTDSLDLAARAAALDPGLTLVEFSLRRALLATRALHVLAGGDTVMKSAGFSPDGTLVVTAGDSGARLYNAGTGALVSALATAVPSVESAAFSPDGQTIVTAEKGRSELWNTDSLTKRKALNQPGATTQATFDRDGGRLLTSGSNRARVWSTVAGTPLSPRVTAPAAITGAALSPDGSRFAIAAGTTVSVYGATDGTTLFALPEPVKVLDIRFSPVGDTIVTAGIDGVARVWDARDGTSRCATLPSDGDLTWVSFSRDGASFLTADTQGDTRVWDTQTCQQKTQLIGDLSKVVAGDFSADDQYAVTAGIDGSARIFSLPDGTQQATLLGHGQALRSVAFSPDGTKAVTTSLDGTARIWDARIDWPEEALGSHAGPATSVAISPDGATVASVGVDGYLRLWSLASHKARAAIAAGAALDDVAFSPDGKLVAAAGADGSTRLWNLKDHRLTATFAQPGSVRAITFSPDGEWLATAGSDNDARVFRLYGSSAPVELQHAAVVNDVAFSPDGNYLATATAGGLAQIWQVGNWQAVRTFAGHLAAVNSVAFNPDSTLLVTASLDHDARIWSVATGKTLRTLVGHAGSVSSAAFSADGRWVVTAGPRTGGIWATVEDDLPNGRLFFISDGHQRLNAASFAPVTVGSTRWVLATAAANGSVATYTCALCADTPELIHLARVRIAQLKGKSG